MYKQWTRCQREDKEKKTKNYTRQFQDRLRPPLPITIAYPLSRTTPLHHGGEWALSIGHGFDVRVRDGIKDVVLQLVVGANVDIRPLVARRVDVVGCREDWRQLR